MEGVIFTIILALIVLIFCLNSIKNRIVSNQDNNYKDIKKRLQAIESKLKNQAEHSGQQKEAATQAPAVEKPVTIKKPEEQEKAQRPILPETEANRWSRQVATFRTTKEEVIAKEEAKEVHKEEVVAKEEAKEVHKEESIAKEEAKELQTVKAIPEVKKEIETPVTIPIESKAEAQKPEAQVIAATVQQPQKNIEKPIHKKEPEGKNDFEKYFGINILSKIGIATLVLGIAYFVKYAIDQNWINETGRVAIGILCGAGLIGIAHVLRKNYRTFSSILIGGGISVLYITIAFAFWDYKLFSKEIAFILLILITALSVFLSIIYNKQVLAVFSLLGGFASPLIISSGSGDYITLFSYIFILNTGMLIIAYRKQWRSISVVAYLLTHLFYWTWLLVSFNNQLAGATLFIFLFFVQFYILAMIEHFRHEQKTTPFQVLIIMGNNFSLFCAALFIFNDFRIDVRGIITIALACINAIPMCILLIKKHTDRNMLYLLIAIVLTFISLAIPIQFNGSAVTMFWAAETVILLWLFNKSSIKVFRAGFYIISMLVYISISMAWRNEYFYKVLPVIFNEVFITGAMVTISVWINVWLLSKNKDNTSQWTISKVETRIFLKAAGIMLLFFVPLTELSYQTYRFYSSYFFVILISGLYFYSFISVFTLFRWNKSRGFKGLYGGLLLTIVSYFTIYLYICHFVREQTLKGVEFPSWGYFAMHYLTYPALIVIYIFLVKKNDKLLSTTISRNFLYWFIAITSTIILSIEVDNLALMLFSGRIKSYSILPYTHTIAYSILWGIISFVFMILGMKYKERSLRVISLTLFILIIGKLYLYDVWKMSQTGRIIAFIFLGILFLLVSFLYQKLKVLLLKEEKHEDDK